MNDYNLERFRERTKPRNDGCVIWVGSINNRGYGTFGMGNDTVMAHRAAHEHYIGPIPAGYDVHHECGVRSCVNHEHLRALSTEDHRGERKTHCKYGHELTPENLYVYPQSGRKGLLRQCKECIRRRGRERAQRIKETE